MSLARTVALTLCLIGGSSAAGQERPLLRMETPEGGVRTASLETVQGFAALSVTELDGLGWTVAVDGGAAVASGPGGVRLQIRAGTPFFRWGEDALQLTDVPYLDAEGRLRVPLQLVSDFLPRRLPARYRFDGGTRTLHLAGAERPARPESGAGGAPAERPDTVAAPAGVRPSSSASEVRVVVIDAGHGGNDPGALGVENIREKTVALGIARALAEELAADENLEVHLIRDGDVLVDLWQRGAIATELKGERPGLFVSIHANSFPARRSVRGFETYFLAEARTDDERRLAAIENAPLRVESSELAPVEDLDFILRDLGNLDHQHWSSLLAEMVQSELATFHPGPNRGVKQGPLAVITNALMPAVLVEVGYLSHREEGPLLGTEGFQRNSAQAVARAIRRFFRRYPPGNGTLGGGGT